MKYSTSQNEKLHSVKVCVEFMVIAASVEVDLKLCLEHPCVSIRAHDVEGTSPCAR